MFKLKSTYKSSVNVNEKTFRSVLHLALTNKGFIKSTTNKTHKSVVNFNKRCAANKNVITTMLVLGRENNLKGYININ